jgi:hypothetical protein
VSHDAERRVDQLMADYGAGAANRLMPASCAFEFSVPGVRRSWGMIEPWERVVTGSIMVDTTSTLEGRLGRTQDDRTWGRRFDVARQLTRDGSDPHLEL